MLQTYVPLASVIIRVKYVALIRKTSPIKTLMQFILPSMLLFIEQRLRLVNWKNAKSNILATVFKQ